MSDKEIAKEILLKIIDIQGLTFEDYPEAKSFTDLVCASYTQILKVVREG